MTDPLARTTSYVYDPVGNLLSKTQPGSATTTYRSDLASQLVGIDYSDATPDVTLVDYDLNGRRTKMIDGTGTSTWVWDSLGRLTSNKNGNNQTVAYEYDLRGNNTKITYPGSTSVDRTFDNASRLWKVKHWLSSTETVFTYDANSFITKWAYPNGTTATYNPDAAGRVDTITHATTSVPPVTFASFGYDRDAAGQVTAVTSTGVPTDDRTFTYTPLGQLATDSGNPYTYDPADNVTGLPIGATLAYDDANQLETMTVSGSGTAYGFDSRGNRTSFTPPGGPATTLTYDQANRLKSYGANASYAYNGDGLRMSKTVSGTTSAFTWDVAQGRPMLLVDGTTNYVYGPGGLPLAQISGVTVTYYHHDQFGSTRALTNSLGLLVATYSYDPHGNLTGSTGSASNPFRFAGGYTDAESGLVYFDGRYYDAVTGQFVTRRQQLAKPPYLSGQRNSYRPSEGRNLHLIRLGDRLYNPNVERFLSYVRNPSPHPGPAVDPDCYDLCAGGAWNPLKQSCKDSCDRTSINEITRGVCHAQCEGAVAVGCWLACSPPDPFPRDRMIEIRPPPISQACGVRVLAIWREY